MIRCLSLDNVRTGFRHPKNVVACTSHGATTAIRYQGPEMGFVTDTIVSDAATGILIPTTFASTWIILQRVADHKMTVLRTSLLAIERLGGQITELN